MLDQGGAKERFTRRRGVLLIIVGVLLFIFSRLFLANSLVNPVGSLPYAMGEVLSFVIVPLLLVSGVIVLEVAISRMPKTGSNLPSNIKKYRRLASLASFSGMLVVLASFIIPQLENLLGVMIGILILAPSAVAWKKIGSYSSAFKISPMESRARTVLGCAMIELVLLAFFGDPVVIILPQGILLLSVGALVGVHFLVSKKRHLVLSGLLAVLGVALYYLITVPELKGVLVVADWTNMGVGLPWYITLCFLSLDSITILTLGGALFLLAAAVSSRMHLPIAPRRRGVIASLLLALLLGTLFYLPWFAPIGVGTMSPTGGFGPGAGIGPMGPGTTAAFYNSSEAAWVYQIKLANDIGKRVDVTGIYGKMATSQTVQIAPPFGDDIIIPGGEKTSTELVVMPQQTAILQITSRNPLWYITMVENETIRWQISFWAPIPSQTWPPLIGSGNQTAVQQGIVGSAVVYVKVVTDEGAAVKNLEVDMGVTPGKPPEGGTAVTNASGIATFHVKPGTYVIYFNTNTFPQNLTYPQNTPSITVSGRGPNQQTVVLQTK